MIQELFSLQDTASVKVLYVEDIEEDRPAEEDKERRDPSVEEAKTSKGQPFLLHSRHILCIVACVLRESVCMPLYTRVLHTGVVCVCCFSGILNHPFPLKVISRCKI